MAIDPTAMAIALYELTQPWSITPWEALRAPEREHYHTQALRLISRYHTAVEEIEDHK